MGPYHRELVCETMYCRCVLSFDQLAYGWRVCAATIHRLQLIVVSSIYDNFDVDKPECACTHANCVSSPREGLGIHT